MNKNDRDHIRNEFVMASTKKGNAGSLPVTISFIPALYKLVTSPQGPHDKSIKNDIKDMNLDLWCP